MKYALWVAMMIAVSTHSSLGQNPKRLEILEVCGVDGYLDMPLDNFLEALQTVAVCKAPRREDLQGGGRFALISLNEKNRLTTVNGDIQFLSGKITRITKTYSEPATKMELAEWMIDLLTKFQQENKGICALSGSSINRPEQHTRTTEIVCGVRGLSLTAGSATVQDIYGNSVKGSFVNVEEVLGIR